jgi:hypothetical protein
LANSLKFDCNASERVKDKELKKYFMLRNKYLPGFESSPLTNLFKTRSLLQIEGISDNLKKRISYLSIYFTNDNLEEAEIKVQLLKEEMFDVN